MHRGYLSGAKAQVNMPELLISSGKAINVAVATENLGQGAKADQKADKILGQLAHAVLCAIMAWLLSVPGEGATDRSCTSSSHCMKLHKALSYSEECVVRTEQKLCYKMLLYSIRCIPRGPLYSSRYMRQQYCTSACMSNLFMSSQQRLWSSRLFFLALWKVRKGKSISQSSFCQPVLSAGGQKPPYIILTSCCLQRNAPASKESSAVQTMSRLIVFHNTEFKLEGKQSKEHVLPSYPWPLTDMVDQKQSKNTNIFKQQQVQVDLKLIFKHPQCVISFNIRGGEESQPLLRDQH